MESPTPPRAGSMDGERATLIFDGRCRLCRDAVDLLRWLDRGRAFACVPFQDRAAVEAVGISPAALATALHVRLPDGRVFVGADAVREVLRRLRGTRWLARAWDVPGAGALARRVYAHVAARRRCTGMSRSAR